MRFAEGLRRFLFVPRYVHAKTETAFFDTEYWFSDDEALIEKKHQEVIKRRKALKVKKEAHQKSEANIQAKKKNPKAEKNSFVNARVQTLVGGQSTEKTSDEELESSESGSSEEDDATTKQNYRKGKASDTLALKSLHQGSGSSSGLLPAGK